MNTISFVNINTLRNWVWEHADPCLDETEINEIAEFIRGDEAFPGWNRNCSEYLESLPPLIELLPSFINEQCRNVIED